MKCYICNKDLSNVDHAILDYKDKYPLFEDGNIADETLNEMDVKHYCIEHEELLFINETEMGDAQ